MSCSHVVSPELPKMELDGPCVLVPGHSNIGQLEFEASHVKAKALFGHVEYTGSISASFHCVNNVVPMAEFPGLLRLKTLTSPPFHLCVV